MIAPSPSSQELISIVIPARNPGPALAGLLAALSCQKLPDCTRLQVIVVDDGSTVPVQTTEPSADLQLSVEVVRRSPGGNRSAARNAGAAAARGPIVVFLDADCRPASSDFIARLREAMAYPDVVAAGGSIKGTGEGFWSRYQSDSRAARQRKAASNGLHSLTAANLAVRRAVFDRSGGFDEGYVGYGFEDRDLLLRLTAFGKVIAAPRATADHMDSLRLVTVASKLHEAGRWTAKRFGDKHSAAYRALGYAALDAELNPWLSPIGQLLGPQTIRTASIVDRWLDSGQLPYSAGKWLVKGICALSFLYGTTLRSKEA